MRAQLSAGLEQLGLALDPEQLDKLLAYIGLLVKWNKTYNLTAVREPDQMLNRHLLDSLALLPYLGEVGASRALVDIGSGAGLPGIPIAIARPDIAVSLLDSLGKRCRFLAHVKRELKLENITVIESRAENWQPEHLPDLITARAVAALPLLIEQTRHLFTPETTLLASKGRWPRQELADLPPDFVLAQSARLDIPGVEGRRHLLSIQSAKS